MAGFRVRLLAALAAVACAAPPVARKAHLASRGGGGKASVVSRTLATQEPPLPAECADSLAHLREGDRTTAAAKCEKENALSDQVITSLQAAKLPEATALTQQAFEKCANFSSTCAAAVAPGVVQELRLSGVALQAECKKTVSKAQSDKTAMKGVRECETKEGIAEGMIRALNTGDMDGAIVAAESGLTKCMKLTPACAFQVSPVLVNQVITMSQMNTGGGMMPVFVRSALQAASKADRAKTSLVGLATRGTAPRWSPAAAAPRKVLL